MTENIEKLSDDKILQLAQKYGTQARLWRQKFIGLLPEVYKRRLYEKKKFGSIFEFAKKLCGLSEEQVRRVLNLEKKFVDKPVLKSLLENGEVSANKLERVASVATVENQYFWAEQSRLLPKKALETLVRDEKMAINELEVQRQADIFWEKDATNGQNPAYVENQIEVSSANVMSSGNLNGAGSANVICGEHVMRGENRNGAGGANMMVSENRNSAGAANATGGENQSGSGKPIFGAKSVPGHGLDNCQSGAGNIFEDIKLLGKFSPELKEKLKMLDSQGHDINKILLELLQNRDQEIAAEKEKIGEEILKKQRSEIVKNAKNNMVGVGRNESGPVNLGKGACASGGEAGMVRGVETENGLLGGPSHYIAVKIKNILTKEQGIKCSMPTCNKPAQEIHHLIPFSVIQNHDPRNLRKLCKEHHILAHSIDVKFHEIRR